MSLLLLFRRRPRRGTLLPFAVAPSGLLRRPRVQQGRGARPRGPRNEAETPPSLAARTGTE